MVLDATVLTGAFAELAFAAVVFAAVLDAVALAGAFAEVVLEPALAVVVFFAVVDFLAAASSAACIAAIRADKPVFFSDILIPPKNVINKFYYEI